ncbi:MAG: hypothetical protein WKF29_10470 [Thermoleophilaceae bacterium]
MRPFLFAVVLLVALVLVAAPATPQVPGNFGAGLPASPATDVDRTQTGAVRIRLRRRLGPGRYVLRLRARTPSGRRAGDRAVLRVKRRVR